MRPIDCAECGKTFSRLTPNQRRCDSCRSPKPPAPRVKPCKKCEQPFTLDFPARRYCDDCRRGSGPVMDVATCPVCNTPFILSGGPGRPRMYCSKSCSSWANANPQGMAEYRRMQEAERYPNG